MHHGQTITVTSGWQPSAEGEYEVDPCFFPPYQTTFRDRYICGIRVAKPAVLVLTVVPDGSWAEESICGQHKVITKWVLRESTRTVALLMWLWLWE